MNAKECAEHNKPLLADIFHPTIHPVGLRWTFVSTFRDLEPDYEEVMCRHEEVYKYITVQFYKNGRRSYGDMLTLEEVSYHVLRMIYESSEGDHD